MTTPTAMQLEEFAMLVANWAQVHGLKPAVLLTGLVQLINRMAPGATAADMVGPLRPKHFPMGKPLNADDNGMMAMGVEKGPDGVIYVVLGQVAINWFALSDDLARDLAKRLIAVADGPPGATMPTGVS